MTEKLGQKTSFDDETIKGVVASGTDLKKYSQQVEKELKALERKSIKDYIKESSNIAQLHNQISACDYILAGMEDMFSSFQTDLGSISSQIINLKKKSSEMSQQLSNRQAFRAPLSQFIDDISVSEDLINAILDLPITENEFLAQLQILNNKINFVKEQSFNDVKCIGDVSEVLNNLRYKAVSKIREYFLGQILKLRKPMANYQVIQNLLLKNKFNFEFLLANKRSVAVEVSEEYIDTMSKVYYSYFKSYNSRLLKLQFEESAGKDDLMGVEDSAKTSLFQKASLKNKSTVFSFGNRGDILTVHLEAPILVPHAAQKGTQKYTYEALFRSEQYALLDNACREYLFLCDFFVVKSTQALQIFNDVMGKSMKLLTKTVESYCETSFDSIALFLCAHIVMRYQMLCHKRAVPALDDYWDALQACIWRRFEVVLTLNIQSVKDCVPNKATKEMGPHFVTRRYAELSAAMVGISEAYPSDLVTHLMAQLQEEVELFILKCAAVFPQRKEQLIFLINNYDMILSVLMERTKGHSKEAESFREQLTNKSNEYVEEILSPYFGGIISFVKECESLAKKQQHDELKAQEKRALQLVKSFDKTWKKALEEINVEVLRSFPSLMRGETLLQLTLTTLVQYYHRFNTLLSPAAKGQLPSIHHIMVEIKNRKSPFNMS